VTPAQHSLRCCTKLIFKQPISTIIHAIPGRKRKGPMWRHPRSLPCIHGVWYFHWRSSIVPLLVLGGAPPPPFLIVTVALAASPPVPPAGKRQPLQKVPTPWSAQNRRPRPHDPVLGHSNLCQRHWGKIARAWTLPERWDLALCWWGLDTPQEPGNIHPYNGWWTVRPTEPAGCHRVPLGAQPQPGFQDGRFQTPAGAPVQLPERRPACYLSCLLRRMAPISGWKSRGQFPKAPKLLYH